MRSNGRAGFTLIEMVIVMALATILIVKIVLLLRMQGEEQSRTETTVAMETNARRVMEQIGYALMGAADERLDPDAPFPFYSSELRYEASLGVVDGEIVWDDPEWVGLTEAQGQLAWKERPDEPDERRVVWTNAVRPFLAGELMNGVDDNDNGLIDEKGLAFCIDRSASRPKVVIRLTLERKDSHGLPLTSTLQETVTCRN
ncbi:MAG: type II secretion system protein J [Planctomycetota bacterium]